MDNLYARYIDVNTCCLLLAFSSPVCAYQSCIALSQCPVAVPKNPQGDPSQGRVAKTAAVSVTPPSDVVAQSGLKENSFGKSRQVMVNAVGDWQPPCKATDHERFWLGYRQLRASWTTPVDGIAVLWKKDGLSAFQLSHYLCGYLHACMPSCGSRRQRILEVSGSQAAASASIAQQKVVCACLETFIRVPETACRHFATRACPPFATAT